MKTGHEKTRYSKLIIGLIDARHAMSDPKRTNPERSDAFQDMVSLGLELRARQTEVEKYLISKTDPKTFVLERVSQLLENDWEPSSGTYDDARTFIRTFVDSR